MQPTGDHDAQKSDAPARVVASPSTNPGFYVNGTRHALIRRYGPR